MADLQASKRVWFAYSEIGQELLLPATMLITPPAMRVALLEDDPDQQALIAQWLAGAGYAVAGHDSAQGMLRALGRDSFDLFVLDWDLPDLSGLQVLKRIRNELRLTQPVLFCTRMETEDHVVAALEAGADDYVIKPLKQREIVARVGSLLRRSGPYSGSQDQRVIERAPYRIDIDIRVISLRGQVLDVSEREFELARFLFERVGQVVSRAHILEAVWKRSAEVNTRTVDVHLSRLRKKLDLSPENGFVLNSIYQHGYRLAPAADFV